VFLDFVHCPIFLKNTTFRKLDLFPSSGKIMVAPPTLLGLLERAASFTGQPQSVQYSFLLSPADKNLISGAYMFYYF
jgi:hypothetical protein